MKPILFETETEAYDEDDIVEMVGRIAKLESAIREHIQENGWYIEDKSLDILEGWIEDHQPVDVRTVKGKE